MVLTDPRLIQLADAASVLLFAGDDHHRCRSAIAFLDQLFRDITGLHEHTADPRDHSAILLPTGSASSPLDAARCLLDARRTTIFLRGVHAAIQQARLRFPGEAIHVMYAGCGPFAPLCLPLLPLLAGQPVHFTLLDVHARAIQSVQSIIAALNLDAANLDFLVSDAAHYRHPAHQPLHVVVSETMQRALEKEPQVAILMNLAPQLAPGGFMVPENIAVDAVLTDPSHELAGNNPVPEPWSGRIPLGHILQLDRERICALAAEGTPAQLPGVRIAIPPKVPAHYALVLTTTIRAFGGHELREYESGLTQPLIVNGWRPGHDLDLTYHLGDKPGFQLAATRRDDPRCTTPNIAKTAE